MNVVIACGGTGGHITPGLAIADLIRDNDPRANILFIGAEGGMEREMVERAGYPIRLLRVRGFSRKLTPANLKTLYLAHEAERAAERLFAATAPEIVIGTGGYVCYPALSAAARMGIPCAVHESNAAPGLAVRRLAARVDRVWLNFSEAAAALPRRAHTLAVGNPLGRGYAVPAPAPLPEGARQMVLSFGGSLGAATLNRAMLAVMERMAPRPDIYCLHATGKREYARIRGEFCAKGLDQCSHLALVPFLADMPRQMAAADLVICRAGAMSVSELAALGKPAILIPSPNVTGNHQYKNAMALAGRGAAVCLSEKELDGRLIGEIEGLLSDAPRRAALSRAVRAFCNPRANAQIWADICALRREKP